MREATVYAKSTGVEIRAITRRRKNGFVRRYGAIRMRFFEMEGEKESIKVVLNCIEAAKVGRVLKKLTESSKAAKVDLLFHSYEREGEKITTKVTAERWTKGKKTGYALVVQRDGLSINVPMDKDTAWYVGLFLEHLALEQSWVSYKPVEEEEEETEDVSPEGEEEEELEF